MPIERSQPLASSLELLGDHARRTGIAPVLSYTLLGDRNDTEPELQAFLALVRDFVRRAEVRPRVSLVRYNRLGPDNPLGPASAERMGEFRRAIGEPRRSGGTPLFGWRRRGSSFAGQLELAIARRGLGASRGAQRRRLKCRHRNVQAALERATQRANRRSTSALCGVSSTRLARIIRIQAFFP